MRFTIDQDILEFESIEHRNFIIDVLVACGQFSKDNLSFLLQKELNSPKLQAHDVRSISRFISSYEEQIDAAWLKQPVNLSKRQDSQIWQEFWLENLKKLEDEIISLSANNCDPESLNLYVGARVKNLVVQVAKDAIKLQKKRYLLKPRTKFLQMIFWKFRTWKIEWEWGKRKKLYGDFEKYDTQREHSPSKGVTILCGFCGTEVFDDWKRPKKILNLDPQIFEIKHERLITISSENSIAKYDEPFFCKGCQSKLQYAHINKVARAVTIVIL
jgi:hypothetical protein